MYLYRVLLDRVHLRLIPPSNIKRAALPERGLLHRPCTGEGGQRDRVSTDPHNQLLYTPPNPYTQATTSKGDRKSELCWIQQINLIIILALFLHIFRIYETDYYSFKEIQKQFKMIFVPPISL